MGDDEQARFPDYFSRTGISRCAELPELRSMEFPEGRFEDMNLPLRVSKKERGFTFVELLIVVILIGIMAAVAIISARTFLARYQLDTETRELTAFLNSVPSEAKRANASVFLIWNASGREFVIAMDSGGNTILDEFKIDQQITLTPPSATTLRCDVLGRAFVGSAAAMMTSPQTMTLQHARVSNSAMKTNRLTVPPLWTVLVDRP